MAIFASLFRYLLALVVLLLAAGVALNGSLAGAVLAALLAILIAPEPSGRLLRRVSVRRPGRLRAAAIAVVVTVLAMIAVSGRPASVYRQPDTRARLLALYEAKLAEWPVAHERIILRTARGEVGVIAAGPADAPPLLLLHASGLTNWSWQPNVAALGATRRLYAIDLIGDAGLSTYDSLDLRLRTGRDEADFYAAIMDALSIPRADVVGASEGGFIASNLALYHPERVRRMVLLAPMGYSGALRSVVRIMFAQIYPLPVVQRATFRWAFSDSPELMREYAEWFPLVMSETLPVKVPPLPFSREELARIEVPVLFVFGSRDALVGDPERAVRRAAAVPGAETAILPTGHLVAAEAPAAANALILGFLGR